MRKALLVGLGVVFGLAFVGTCGKMKASDVMNPGAEGGVAGGGSDGIIDVSHADAQTGGGNSSVAMSGSCNKTTARNGLTWKFAEFSIPSLDPTQAPHVSAVVCGISNLPPFYPACPTCTDYSLPASSCWSSPFVAVAPGKVIVQCGTETWSSTAVYVKVD